MDVLETVPIGQVLEEVEKNTCPSCGRGFILIAFLPEGRNFQTYHITDDVCCPLCSPVDTSDEVDN